MFKAVLRGLKQRDLNQWFKSDSNQWFKSDLNQLICFKKIDDLNQLKKISKSIDSVIGSLQPSIRSRFSELNVAITTLSFQSRNWSKLVLRLFYFFIFFFICYWKKFIIIKLFLKSNYHVTIINWFLISIIHCWDL